MAENKPTPQDVMNELQAMMNAHVKLAFEQYKEIKDMYWQNEKTIEFMKAVAPKAVHETLDKTKNWMDEQIHAMEENIDRILGETRTWNVEGGVPAPAIKEIQKMVTDHMKLAFRQYKELKQKYGTPSKATIAFMKSVAPENAHEALDKLDAWIEAQVSNAEGYMEKALESTEEKDEPAVKKKKK